MTTEESLSGGDRSPGPGKLFVVGIGPGGPLDRTHRAERAIQGADIVVGYKRYLKLIEDLTQDKRLVATGMTKEKERCRMALELAAEGNKVALVSSGDPGVYGMAGLALEMNHKSERPVEIEVVPGVTAASAAGNRLGAPLMLDFAVISLSDLLVPWDTIRHRLEHVAAADLVVALYNPRSHKRVRQLEEAVEIFCRHRPPETPVGIGTAVGTEEETIVHSNLAHLLEQEVGMRSVVLIGNRTTVNVGPWMLTPRGYEL